MPLNSVVAAKVGPDDHGSFDWESELPARSRASSLLDKPIGKDTTCGDETGELNWGAWIKVILSGLTYPAQCCCESIRVSVSSPDTSKCVWLNGVKAVGQFDATTTV